MRPQPPPPTGVHVTNGAVETEVLAARLAQALEPGDVVLIAGELGAGKTTFVRGACRALGVTGRVTSPTFTIGQRYDGQVPISHLDLYRLADLGGEDPALLTDYIAPERIAFIEWPEVAEGFVGAPVTARVRLAHRGGDSREIAIDVD